MRVVLLNSPILTGWGRYSFVPLTVEEARELAEREGYDSAIGHESTALFLSQILGLPVECKRRAVAMGWDDEYNKAIVLRLRGRLPEGKVLSGEEIQQVEYDLCLLEWEGP